MLPNSDEPVGMKALLAILMGVMFALASATPPIPSHIVPFWEEGSCQWFNGTVVDKEIVQISPQVAEYKFYVEGTLDNNTSVDMIIYGGPLYYQALPINTTYEGQVCDTLPLREAIMDGTIHFVSVVFS